MNSVALFFILAVVLLVIGVPVATTLGLSSVIFIILEGIPTSTVIQRMFAGVDVVALMCIPFFILAGDLMAKGLGLQSAWYGWPTWWWATLPAAWPT